MRIRLIALIALFCLSLSAQEEELAQAYFENGEFVKSLDIYLQLYDSAPARKFYDGVLQNYKSLEELRKAERFTENHLKRNPPDRDYFLAQLGIVRRLRDDEEGAREAFEEILSQVDKNPGRVYPITRLFQEQQLFREALEAFERAEKQNPNLMFHYQKAQIYGELGDIEKVYEELLILVEKQPAYLQNIRGLLAQSLSDDPDDPTNVFLKEQILRRIQESNDAVFTELLVWVFIQESNFKGAFRQLRGLDMREDKQQREIFEFGMTCMRNEEYAVAEMSFEYIVSKGNVSPAFIPAQIGLLKAKNQQLFGAPQIDSSAVQQLSQEYEERLGILPLNIETAPAYRDWYRLRAFHLGDTAHALSGLEQLMEIPDPERQSLDETYLTYADILSFSGRYYEAILYYARVEKARPGTDLADQAKFRRARVAFYKGEFDWAQNLFDALKFSVSKHIANDAMAYSILIRNNMGLDTNTEALSFYAKAELLKFRQLYPEALQVLDTLEIGFYGHSLQDEVLWMRAQISLKMGQPLEAKKHLSALLAEHGDDILADNALMALAELMEQEGDNEAAQALYQQLLTEHPDSFFIAEARSRIRRLRGEQPM